jgi:hypothetical protein
MCELRHEKNLPSILVGPTALKQMSLVSKFPQTTTRSIDILTLARARAEATAIRKAEVKDICNNVCHKRYLSIMNIITIFLLQRYYVK